VGHIVGVEVLDEYVFKNEQIHLLILHGDQFDRFVNNYGWLTEIACMLFYFIQRWAPHHAARYIRRVSKKWQRSSHAIRIGAIAYARSKGIRHVTCGHTHLSSLDLFGDMLYANSGTWTEHPPCPFVSVRGGEVRLEYWPEAPRAKHVFAATISCDIQAQSRPSQARTDSPYAYSRTVSQAAPSPSDQDDNEL
jgi:UDP-2,3-diacylglucosamine pyrophosphatase LpxH